MELERDEFGTTRLDPDSRTLELVWTDATTRMKEEQFRAALARLAGFAEEHRPQNILIDVTEFAFRPAPDMGRWRDSEIIPRYNRAGVAKFAFLVPSGAPGAMEAGGSPEPEGPAAFPTAYFEGRQRALDWFAAG